MSGARKYAMHRSFILRNSLVLKNSVAVVGEPVGVGALDGAVALCAVAPEPLKLGLVVGGPIGTAVTSEESELPFVEVFKESELH